MPSKVDVNIDFAKTNLDNALDHYYSFLRRLVSGQNNQLSPNQRLALTNTITSIGFIEKKKYYNTQIFRAFSDLTVLDGADPKKSGSPVQGAAIDNIIGSPDLSSAWSTEYRQVALPYVINAVNENMSTTDKLELDNLETKFDTQYDAYIDKLNELETEWDAVVETKELERGSEDYWIAYRKWWGDRNRSLARKLEKAKETEIKIEVLLNKSATPDTLWMVPIRNQLLKPNLVPLPIDPELENETTATVEHRPGFWDIRPSIRPAGLGDFDLFLKEDEEQEDADQTEEEIEDNLTAPGRSYEVSSAATATFTHDKEWKVSGRTGYFFCRGRVSASKKSHFEDSASKLLSVKVGFRHIDEMVVIRDSWFSKRLLNDEKFIEYVKNQSPTTMLTLSNCIVSVIVARGLCVRLSFSDDYSSSEWEKVSGSAGGGFSIGGWKFGMKGGYKESKHWTTTRNKKNEITFVDNLSTCRVIGFRVENVIDAASASPNFFAKAAGAESLAKQVEALELLFKSGKLTYVDFMENYHELVTP